MQGGSEPRRKGAGSGGREGGEQDSQGGGSSEKLRKMCFAGSLCSFLD